MARPRPLDKFIAHPKNGPRQMMPKVLAFLHRLIHGHEPSIATARRLIRIALEHERAREEGTADSLEGYDLEYEARTHQLLAAAIARTGHRR